MRSDISRSDSVFANTARSPIAISYSNSISMYWSFTMVMHQSQCYSNIPNWWRNLSLALDYSALDFLVRTLCLKCSDLLLHWPCCCGCHLLSAGGVCTLSWPGRCLESWKCCYFICHRGTWRANSSSNSASEATHLNCCAAYFYCQRLCFSCDSVTQQPCSDGFCSSITHYWHWW